jgi:hypothetical protein
MTAPKTIKVKFATYTRNNGDGSASVLFFPTLKAAQTHASKDDERFDDADDTGWCTLEFDESGNLIVGKEGYK